MNLKKSIVIIPARGGSKRLLNKNRTLLGGVPLIVHSINFAKENGIETIVVSTDDATIKKTALLSGAQVIDRPAELATDESPTIDTLKHVLEGIHENYENVILLQPTNPLRPKNLLKEAYTKFIEGKYDSLMTVSRNHQKFGKIVKGKFIPFNYQIGQRSQELEPLYFENGLLYITRASLILEDKILGENNYPFIVNHPFASVDIDTREDFEYAEYLLSRHFE
jgi:N-acylneuraminate cytidylyltransferase